MYTKERAVKDYSRELSMAIEWKEQGQTLVDADTAGEVLANERENVPIDEYIDMWKDGLIDLLTNPNVNPEDYSY